MTSTIPSRAIVAITLPLATSAVLAAAPTGSFVTSTWAVGLSGVRAEDFKSGTGQTTLSSTSDLVQNDFTLDALGRQGTRAADSLNNATASATRVRARSSSDVSMAAQAQMGTIGGGTTGNARASVQVPFMIDAAGLTGSMGSLQVPILISGGLLVDAGIPVTPFAPWPGNSSGEGRVLIDVSGSLQPAPTGGCTAGFPYCSSISDSGAIRSVSGSVPSLVLMTMGFRFGDWTSYNMSVEVRSGASANAVAPGQVASDAAATHGAVSDWTVRWGGIAQVLTGPGDVAQNWTVQSLDGVDLRLAAPIPEPASWALLGTGLALLLARVATQRTASWPVQGG